MRETAVQDVQKESPIRVWVTRLEIIPHQDQRSGLIIILIIVLLKLWMSETSWSFSTRHAIPENIKWQYYRKKEGWWTANPVFNFTELTRLCCELPPHNHCLLTACPLDAQWLWRSHSQRWILFSCLLSSALKNTCGLIISSLRLSRSWEISSEGTLCTFTICDKALHAWSTHTCAVTACSELLSRIDINLTFSYTSRTWLEHKVSFVMVQSLQNSLGEVWHLKMM